MGRQIYLHDSPDRCVIGTVGEPGQRVFFLQAKSGRRVNAVVLEKQQVQVLAERMDALLDEMVARGQVTAEEVEAPATADEAPLDAPIDEDFRAGALALGWNSNTHRLILEAHEAADADAAADVPNLEDDEGTGGATLRVRLMGNEARAFVRRARAVVAAGRPLCPFCHLPLDPDGHICPRSNGYRR